MAKALCPEAESNEAVGVSEERQTMARSTERELQGTLEMLPVLTILKDNEALRYYEYRSLVLICKRYAQKLKDEIASTKDSSQSTGACSHCEDYAGYCPYCYRERPNIEKFIKKKEYKLSRKKKS